MPRKNLDKYSLVKHTFNFHSKKNGELMYCESHAEKGALLELEYDPQVLRYQTQPQSFQYRVNGCKRRYTPDILVKTVGNTFRYEEVKTREGAKNPKFQEKFNRLTILFRDRIRVPLRLRISDATHRDARLGNLWYLYSHLHYPLTPPEQDLLRSIRFPISLMDAVGLVRDAGHRTDPIYAAMAQGLVTYSASKRIRKDTVLEVCNV